MGEAVKESNLGSISSIEASEHIRVVAGDQSSKITVSNFVTSIRQLLLDQGFITSVLVTQTRKVMEITGNYALTTDNEILNVNCSGGDVTVSLFDSQLVYDQATKQSRLYQIKKTDKTENKLIIKVTGIDTLDGDDTLELIGPYNPFVNIYAGPFSTWWSI